MNHRAIWPLVTLTALDRLLTIPNFQHEANPLVLGMGKYYWLGLTALLILSMLGTWYYFEVWNSKLAVAVTILTTLVTAGVVLLNLYVLL